MTTTGEDTLHRGSVSDALRAIRRGEPVVLTGLDEAGGAAALVMAAELASAETIATFISHTSGLISVALPPQRADELDLPLMAPDGGAERPYTVTVDLASGISTGISAYDRAATIKALASAATRPSDLARPGHVMPLRSAAGGVLERLRHTEASLDLVRMAGMMPAAVVCALLGPDKDEVLNGQDARAFALEHEIPCLSIEQVAAHVLQQQRVLMTTAVEEFGRTRLVTITSEPESHTHLVYELDGPTTPEPAPYPPTVGVHVACAAGDVFGATLCACGDRLRGSLAQLRTLGPALLIYVSPEAAQVDPHALSSGAEHDVTPSGVARMHALSLLVSQILATLGLDRVRLLDDGILPGNFLGIEVVERVPSRHATRWAGTGAECAGD